MGKAHAALMVLGVQTTVETVRVVFVDLANVSTFLRAATIASSDSNSPDSPGSGADATTFLGALVMAKMIGGYSFALGAVAAPKL